MPKPGRNEELYTDSGLPLPYRAEADVDRVVGKMRKTNRSDPRGLENFPLAQIYGWKITSRLE